MNKEYLLKKKQHNFDLSLYMKKQQIDRAEHMSKNGKETKTNAH